MNPTTNTIIGNPIINSKAKKTPAPAKALAFGIAAAVALVAVVTLFMIWDNISEELPRMANRGADAKAKNKPTINAHIADMADNINANGTTGIDVTSLPSNSSFTPPNRGTSVL